MHLFFRRDSPQCAKKAIYENYLTANICQNYLTLYIILKLLPSTSFICCIAIQNPPIIKKVLFSQIIVVFTLYQELTEPYFPLEFLIFSQLHPVLINFRISSPSKQSKQALDMPKSICFKFFGTVKHEFVVPAIIFWSASLQRFV
jgi:hypothetical protein